MATPSPDQSSLDVRNQVGFTAWRLDPKGNLETPYGLGPVEGVIPFALSPGVRMKRSDSTEGDNPKSQSNLTFDDSPQRFLAGHPEDHFSGSSGMLFEQAMAQTRMAICLTDPHQPDNPIIFANRAFRSLTGYDEQDILGRNCRFLQGPDTDREAVRQLGEAIAQEDVRIVELLNYRKDGTSFWNALHVGPVYDDTGKLAYFFGSQWDVSDLHVARAREQTARLMARELSHRMKNMFSVISAIVNVTGRVRGIQNETGEITARIQALGRAYEATLDDAATGLTPLKGAIVAALEPYGERVSVDGEDVPVPFGVVSSVGIMLHELAANAGKYGAWTVPGGSAIVTWRKAPDYMLELEWKEEGGPALVQDDPEPGTGMMIIDRLLRASGGTITRHWNPDGLVVRISLPLGEGA